MCQLNGKNNGFTTHDQEEKVMFSFFWVILLPLKTLKIIR